MKQEIISFLSTIKDEISNLSKYIYENSEESFHEYKAYNYIMQLLKKHNFDVTENYLNISTAFRAQFGEGYPKVCFICEYDGVKDNGQIYGYNLVSSMSIAAALGLSKVLPKVGGSVVLLGCPGETVCGSKVTMEKQGAFEDIDVVLMAQPHIVTSASGTSMAMLPLEFKFKNITEPTSINDVIYSTADAASLTFNALNILTKSYGNNCTINNLSITENTKDQWTSEIDLKFSLKAKTMSIALSVENKIKEFINSTCRILNIKSEEHIFNLPCKELITSTTLSRLFSHNLKECGIIDIEDVKNIYSSISLGCISHVVPCIHPYICITEDKNIKYGSPEFASATILPFAQERVIKAAEALAITALDLIEKQSLISEARNELYREANKPLGVTEKELIMH